MGSQSKVLNVSTFESLGVPPVLARSLKAQRILAPFPIQVAAVPPALNGADLCGRAPTGSGKTIAFAIPLAAGCSAAEPRRPTGLVLVPTRELAEQVAAEVKLLANAVGLITMAAYGGVPLDRHIRQLERGVDILVACPGRLRDLIDRGHIALGSVEIAVVDEADRLADMGFLPEVRRLMDETPESRQTLLFSATLDGEVAALIERYQRDPVMVSVDEAKGANTTSDGRTES